MAWKEHDEHLHNAEFSWSPEDLTEETPDEGPSEPITPEIITKTISRKSLSRAAGPSGVVAEMLKPAGEAGAARVCDLIEAIISEGKIPSDWQESYIMSLFNSIFFVRQLQENHLASIKHLYII